MRIQEFDYAVDLTQSILWQYNEATNLLGLITLKQAWYNIYQTQFWQNWYTNVFNLQTADLFGIVVWSYILNVPLFVLNEPEPSDKPIWGFAKVVILEGTTSVGTDTITGLSDTSNLSVGMRVVDGDIHIPNPTTITSINSSSEITISNNATGNSTENITFILPNSYLNFGNGNFSTMGQLIPLTLEEQRFLLRLRYFQLTTRGDVTDINYFLNYLVTTSDIGFTGQLYMLDGLNMSITYVFTTDDFPSNLLDVIQTLDTFPRPAGVGISYSTL